MKMEEKRGIVGSIIGKIFSIMFLFGIIIVIGGSYKMITNEIKASKCKKELKYDINSAAAALNSYYAEYHKYPQFPISLYNNQKQTAFYNLVSRSFSINKPDGKFVFTVHSGDVISIINSNLSHVWETGYKIHINISKFDSDLTKIYCRNGYVINGYNTFLNRKNSVTGGYKNFPYEKHKCNNRAWKTDKVYVK